MYVCIYVGPPSAPYNIEALHKALWCLHGHYRLSPLVNACQDCQDWSTLSVLYGLEGQWPQVGYTLAHTYTHDIVETHCYIVTTGK